MKKMLITLAAILMIIPLLAGPAAANTHRLNGHTVSVSISDDNGRSFNMFYPLNTEYSHRNRRRVWVQRRYLQVTNGSRYNINIRNMTGERIGVVVAVDGRNIISGKKSRLRRNERMYIIGPYETENFNGWRTARDVVNRFYFTNAGNSYAHAWHDDTAMGVIALAVYRERPVYRDKRQQIGKMQPEMMKQGRSSAPGTGFGEEEYSPSVRVPFRTHRRPVEKIFIKYEWRQTLCRIGVIDCRPPRTPHNRFWDDEDRCRSGYYHRGPCQDYDDEYAPYPPYRSRMRRLEKGTRID